MHDAQRPAIASSPGTATTLSRNTDAARVDGGSQRGRSPPRPARLPESTHSSANPAARARRMSAGRRPRPRRADRRLDRRRSAGGARSTLANLAGGDTPSTAASVVAAPRSPANGGRFGPRRTTSSRENSVRTARPCRSASSRRAVATGELALPPNAPPLASGLAGSPPGTHHDASGSRYAGLDPARREPHATVGQLGQRQRRRGVHRRPPSLHLARRLARLEQRFRDHPLDARRPRRSRRRSRAGAAPRPARRGRGVVGEPTAAERNLAPDPLARRRLRARPASRRGVESRGAPDRRIDDVDRVRRRCASRCTGTGARPARGRRRSRRSCPSRAAPRRGR